MIPSLHCYLIANSTEYTTGRLHLMQLCPNLNSVYPSAFGHTYLNSCLLICWEIKECFGNDSSSAWRRPNIRFCLRKPLRGRYTSEQYRVTHPSHHPFFAWLAKWTIVVCHRSCLDPVQNFCCKRAIRPSRQNGDQHRFQVTRSGWSLCPSRRPEWWPYLPVLASLYADPAIFLSMPLTELSGANQECLHSSRHDSFARRCLLLSLLETEPRSLCISIFLLALKALAIWDFDPFSNLLESGQ